MRVEAFDVIVVGTGAAGYNAASRIQQEGTKTVCIVTEGVNRGTSRNTGSDKQTYYKLGLGGDSPDSVAQMAQDLFSCGSVDGDTALCEAALSARCFMHLVELGVPFPVNRYGEYVGYKTDHDPFARATSAGPLMSKFMTEALERMAQEQHIPVFDATYAVEILRDDAGVCGLLCLDMTGGRVCGVPVRGCHSGHRRSRRDLCGQCVSRRAYRLHGACPCSRCSAAEYDRVAVRSGVCRAPLECVGHLYAGAAPIRLGGWGRKRA